MATEETKNERINLKNVKLHVIDEVTSHDAQQQIKDSDFVQIPSYFIQIISVNEKSIQLGVTVNSKKSGKHMYFIKENKIAPTSVKQLVIGDKCEIYSHSRKKWYLGEIIDIFSDKQGEWLKIKYAAILSKDIQRFSEDIRIPKHTLKHASLIVQKIDVWRGEGFVTIPIDDKHDELYDLGLYKTENAKNVIGNSKGIQFRILKDKNKMPPNNKNYNPKSLDLSTVFKALDTERNKINIYWTVPSYTFGENISYKIMYDETKDQEIIEDLPFCVPFKSIPLSFKVVTVAKIENNIYESNPSDSINCRYIEIKNGTND